MDFVEDIVTVAHIIKLKWGGHVARMGQRRWAQSTSVWDIRLGERALGDRRPNGQTPSRKQQDRGHEQPKIGANGEYTHKTFVKATSLGIARLAVKALELSVVPPEGRCPHGINSAYLFMHLFMLMYTSGDSTK